MKLQKTELKRGDALASFIKYFSTNSFQYDQNICKYKMIITDSETHLYSGSDVRVSKLLRMNNGNYENTILSYDIDIDGNVEIYSDEIFEGVLVITTDSQ